MADSGPLARAINIVPDDDVVLPMTSRAIWIGAAGDLTVLCSNMEIPTLFTNLYVGWHPLQVTKIFATGTTADNIVICS